MDKLFLSALSILTAFIATIAATDIYLPSMPKMVNYFGISAEVIRMTIPSYFIGSFLTSLMWGTLSDHVGRRPTLLIGLSLFLLGTLICAVSPSIYLLFGARFVQGMGAVAVPVVGWAAIQDLYPAEKSVKIISHFGTVMTISPMIAPILGGFIDVTLGWRGTFGLIAILAVISLTSMCVVMIEPMPDIVKKKVHIGDTLQNYYLILKHRVFLCSVLTFAFLAAGEWCFLTLSPFYFGNTLQLEPDVFGIYISASGIGYVLGTFITPRIMAFVGLDKTMLVGLWISLIGCGLLVIPTVFHVFIEVFICLAIGLYFVGASLVWSTSTAKALQCFEHIRGSASAIRGIILTSAAVLGGFVGSYLDYNTLIPLMLFLLLTIAASMSTLYLALKEQI